VSTSSDLSSHFSSPLKAPEAGAGAGVDDSPTATFANRPPFPAFCLDADEPATEFRPESSLTRLTADSKPGYGGGANVAGVSSTGGKTIGLEAVDKIGDLVSDLSHSSLRPPWRESTSARLLRRVAETGTGY
jgi:hypothetical protein